MDPLVTLPTMMKPLNTKGGAGAVCCETPGETATPMKKRMLLQLDDLHQLSVRRKSAEPEARLLEAIPDRRLLNS